MTRWIAILFLLAGHFWFASLPCHAADSAQAEWEKTVKAAEAEGQVSIYIAGYGQIVDAGLFQKAFPKIKVISVTGSGTDLTRRLAAERRAEKYLADVYNGGGYSLYQNLYLTKGLDSIKSALILPEVIDTSKWWENRHRFVDDENRHIFIYEANVSEGGGPAFNNLQLKPEEYKSYWDFLNPKLKGKIVSLDPRKAQGAGGSWQYLYYHPELGPKFIKRLYGEMDVTMAADLRQITDWLANGKFALCLPCQATAVVKGQNQGLPLGTFAPNHFREGANISSAFGQMALLNRAPHPNATKVFINWYLSREGQTAFQKLISSPGGAKNSRRIDIPKDHIPPEEARVDGLKYFDTDAPGSRDLAPLTKLLNEITPK